MQVLCPLLFHTGCVSKKLGVRHLYHWHETCRSWFFSQLVDFSACQFWASGLLGIPAGRKPATRGSIMLQGTVSFSPIDKAVAPDLQAFLVNLSHLPVEVQIDLLRDATAQITEAVEQTLA